MTFDDYLAAVRSGDPVPASLSEPLQALFQDARGDWEGAHDTCQKALNPDGDWIHAYLHRKEGDLGNAAYWYSRAGKPVYKGGHDDEWTAIAKALLKG